MNCVRTFQATLLWKTKKLFIIKNVYSVMYCNENVHHSYFVYQALLERDAEIKKVREEGVHLQRDLESQLSSETAANQELQVIQNLFSYITFIVLC